ncbi:hypothetical protein GEMRC1_007536 [Eukaryota sp. GEM-RC1]
MSSFFGVSSDDDVVEIPPSESSVHSQRTQSTAPTTESSPPMKKTRTMKSRSRVWDYFKIDKARNVVFCTLCNNCEYSIAQSPPSTGNMSRHLSNKHGDWQSGNPSNQLTMDSFLAVAPSVKTQNDLEESLLKLIITQNVPFSILESNHLQDFVQIIHSMKEKPTVPSRRSFGRLLKSKYCVEREETTTKMHTCDSPICLTVDGWSGRQQKHFLGITAHFIDDAFNYHNFCLDVVEIKIQQTTKNLKDLIVDIMIKFKLIHEGKCRVFAMTCDNARNIVKAGSLLKAEWAIETRRCGAHVLNLIVKQGLEPIKPAIGKVRAFVLAYRTSILKGVLNRFCASKSFQKINTLKDDVETRWNSTYDMLKSYQDAMIVIKNFFAEPSVSSGYYE